MSSPAHLGRLVEKAAERHGDYDCMLFEGRWHRSGDLLARSARIATGLAQYGLIPGDRVVVMMPNRPEVLLLYAAIWRAGGIATPALHALSAADLRHVVEDSKPRFLVITSDLLATVREACAELEEAPREVCVDPSERFNAMPLAALEAAEPGPVAAREPDDVAALLYTGGTTGRSKGVMLSHAALSFAGWAAADSESSHALERELVSLPLSHSFGLVEMLSAIHSGLRKVWVLEPRFNAGRALSLIQEHRIQKTQVVPSMLQLLLSQPVEDFDVSSLRWMGCGGAPLAPEVIHAVRRRLPSVVLIEGYGLTESGSVATANLPENAKIGSVGPAMRGIEIRIVDAAGSPVPTGETGDICVRSPSSMLGYWNAPEQSAEILRDGWVHTGDVGYLDSDGYLFVLDRKKDVIIRGGFNIFPRDVEDALLEHRAVGMAAVIGRPDRLHGEEVVAFVTLAGDAAITADQLVQWGRQRIGGYKYPREVHIVAALPTTGVGKVDRKALRLRLG